MTGPRIFILSLCALATLNIIFGVLDILTYVLGISYVLDFMRSGGYLVHLGHEFAGFRRAIGSFPEASSFAAFSFMMFAGMFVMWIHDWGGWRVTAVMIGNFVLTVISTSTTGYAALALFSIFAVGWLSASFLSGRLIGKTIAVFGVLLTTTVISLGLHLFDVIPQGVYDVLDLTFRKDESASAADRGMMNVQAWNNFLETYGLGAGLGSARASGFAYVLLSNLGVAGFVCLSIFLFQVLSLSSAKGSRDSQVLLGVAKSQMVAVLVVSSISGGVFDLGVLFYLACALAAGMRHAVPFVPTAREHR